MIVNEKKLNRQLLGRDKWFDNNCQGIYDYHTGVGKTYLAILCIKQNELIQRSSYLVVVPNATLVKQWELQLTQHLPKYVTERILIKTVDTLLNDELLYEIDTLIIDELHEFSTELRLTLLDKSKIKNKKFLGLTASGDDSNFKKILKYYKIIDKISEEEAKEEGYVAEFIEYNLGLTLLAKERESYDKLTEVISKLMPRFSNDLSLTQKVLSGGKDQHGKYYVGAGWARAIAFKNGWRPDLDLQFTTHRELDDLWNPNRVIGYANSLMTAIRNRKALLHIAYNKYDATLKLVTKFDKVKTILFSESTLFCDKIGEILLENNHKVVTYHSSVKTIMSTSEKTGKILKLGKTRLKNLALKGIREGTARILNTAKSLDKGLDVVDIRMGITTSGTQNPTQYKQRGGRVKRKEEKSLFSDVPVLLVNLYIAGTQDEKWLLKRQSKSNHSIIIVNSIDDINYYPPPNIEFTLKDL